MREMDAVDIKILSELQNSLPLKKRPFKVIGERVGIGESEVLERLENLKEIRVIRRFGARINQRALGITANALVAWKTDGDTSDVGVRLATMPGVTHCYERRTVPGRWEFQLYTVHHGWSRGQVQEQVESVAREMNLSEYVLLFSTHEYKRTPHMQVSDLGINHE